MVENRIEQDRERLVRLRRRLAAHFSLDELRTLCFDLGIAHENLPDTLDGMARELVRFCERHGRISELMEVLNQLRPGISFNARDTTEEVSGELVQVVIAIQDYGTLDIPSSSCPRVTVIVNPRQRT